MIDQRIDLARAIQLEHEATRRGGRWLSKAYFGGAT